MANKIRITSDGTSQGTKVFACNRENGVYMPLSNVVKIEFLPLEPDEVLRATITFDLVEIDVMIDAGNVKVIKKNV